MSYEKNYSNSPAPQFDAVEDIKEWLGQNYDRIANEIGQIKNARRFTFYCAIAGIYGYPVLAWYDHFNGQGAFDKNMDAEQ